MAGASSRSSAPPAHVTSVRLHNGMFDFAILAWRLGIHPKLMVDTLGMARAAGHKKASENPRGVLRPPLKATRLTNS